MPEPCIDRNETQRREFEATVLVHLDALYNLALRTTRDPSAAEDLVQDTMVRAYRFFGRFQQGTNARAWLFAILRNTHINSCRRGARELSGLGLDLSGECPEGPGFPALRSEARSPEDSTSDGRLAEALRRALDGLPSEFRMAAVLSMVEGCTYSEIASIMSCPIGTVMSRVHRARHLLQEALREHADERGLRPRDASPFAYPVRTMETHGVQRSAV